MLGIGTKTLGTSETSHRRIDRHEKLSACVFVNKNRPIFAPFQTWFKSRIIKEKS